MLVFNGTFGDVSVVSVCRDGWGVVSTLPSQAVAEYYKLVCLDLWRTRLYFRRCLICEYVGSKGKSGA